MKSSMRFSFVCVFAVLACVGKAQETKRNPVKVSVKFQSKSVAVDSSTDVNVMLLDADNKVVKAMRDMEVRLDAFMPSGDTVTQHVTIKAGDSTAKAKVKAKGPGIIDLRAKNKELLEGGAFLKASEKKKTSTQQSIHDAAKKGPRVDPNEYEIFDETDTAFQDPVKSIQVRISPQRTILANGKDTVRIEAFLMEEDEAPVDIKVMLSGDWKVTPIPLVIHKGAVSGETYLTSKEQGTVNVQVIRCVPKREVNGEREFKVKFGPAITKLAVKASPPRITLVEDLELVARLSDEDSNLTKTDVERDVSFAIEDGRGKIDPSTVKIDSSKSEARARFRPTTIGEMRLSTSTPSLLTSVTNVKVTMPVLLSILTILGGAIGGLIAARTSKTEYLYRTLIGVATGFVLYWGVLFGLLGNEIPREFVLNPFSGLAIPILGGWAGTAVFNFFLKRFGIAGG